MSKLMLQAINLLKNGYAGVLPKYVSRTLPTTGTEIRFLYEGDLLKKLVTKNTKLICMNNPNNPTGAVIPKNIFSEIVKIK